MSLGIPCRASAIALLSASIVCFCSPPLAAVEPPAPGLHDLVVFDPGVHDRGLPAVQFKDVNGNLKVDIPPTVHVHRYYYSGDKEIQGPIIQGGPTVVVANHPKTGKRMYIDVVLPAGAPRIAYNKHSITYIYPNQRVEVKFAGVLLDPEKATIKNHSGRGWGRSIRAAHKKTSKHIKESMSNSQLVQSIKEVGKDTGNLLKGATSSLGELAVQGTDGLKSLTDMVPGVVYLRSLAEQKPDRDYKASIRAAARQKVHALPDFVPTNR